MQTEKPTALLPKFDSQLRKDDVEGIIQLVTRCGVFHPGEIAIAGELAQARLSGQDMSYHFIFFRNEHGAPLAYSCYGEIPLTAKRYDLYWIAVDPTCQGTGLGYKLLCATESHIKQLEGAHVYAETSSKPSYAAARHFYVQTGYEKVAQMLDFYAEGDDKVIYRKVL